MVSTADAVHRWLCGDDAWPPGLVSRLFERLSVHPADVIYDPFVGWGTTAVVAQARALRSVAADGSPLAVLTTRCKVHRPPLNAVAAVQEMLHTCDLAAMLRDFRYGKMDAPWTKFALAAGLVRSSWFAGADLDPEEVRASALRVVGEMAADVASLPNYSAAAMIHHRAFRADAETLPRDNLVMVTSLPFSGSNINPRRVKLEKVLAPGTAVACGAPWDYSRFLREVVEHLAKLRCRAFAVEVEAEYAPLLANRAATAGFAVMFHDDPDIPSGARLVLGWRR